MHLIPPSVNLNEMLFHFIFYGIRIGGREKDRKISIRKRKMETREILNKDGALACFSSSFDIGVKVT